MKTCRDCVHFDVCDALDRMNGLTKPGPRDCGFFKDKDLIIDLPCPAEHDSLFAIVDLYHRKKIVGQTIAKYDIDCIIVGFLQRPVYRCCNGNNEWIDFDGDEIGKTVFLTHEAAEAALKGEQNG